MVDYKDILEIIDDILEYPDSLQENTEISQNDQLY